MSYWRTTSRRIIAQVIAEVGLADQAKLRAALLNAYPFMERRYHPYKIWLDEIKVQTGKKPPTRRGGSVPKVDRASMDLFEGDERP